MKYWRTPLDHDQVKLPRGEVRIIVDRCKGCGFCVEYCPKDVLVLSEEFNKKGYHPPKVVREGECVNCELCELICPDFAIYSVAVTDGDGGAVEGKDTGSPVPGEDTRGTASPATCKPAKKEAH